MRIRGITVRVPPLLFAVTVFFAAVCAMMFGSTKDLAYLYFGAPLCVVLICVPLAMNYLTEKQLAEQLPAMRVRAKFSRARQISPAMVGTPVIVEGKILKVTGLLMGKPAYLLSDSTGQIVVRRFALPDPLVGVGAAVEVVGTVARKITNGDEDPYQKAPLTGAVLHRNRRYSHFFLCCGVFSKDVHVLFGMVHDIQGIA